MNVTEEIRRKRLIYGASDNTNPANVASAKALNYAQGATIQYPERSSISTIPYTLNYTDTVGLFGTENHFVRVELNIIGDILFVCYEEPGWECAAFKIDESILDPFYDEAIIDLKTSPPVNTYSDAIVQGNVLPNIGLNRGYISVELENLKTGNQYIDDWLDIRLYTQSKEEHPFQKMYVRSKSYFYIGFHARNTKRLDYNVRCVIGNEYRSLESIENPQLVMRQ